MYIDSLTITALLIFLGALYLFIRFCMVRVCGLKPADKAKSGQSMQEGKS